MFRSSIDSAFEFEKTNTALHCKRFVLYHSLIGADVRRRKRHGEFAIDAFPSQFIDRAANAGWGYRVKDDYGYFGKGITGYVHYMEAFRRNNGDGRKPRGGKSGCFTALTLLALGAGLLLLLL